ASLRQVASRPGMVAVISDFLATESWPRLLRAVGGRHDVIAIEVLDRRELVLPDVGLVQLLDPESGRRRLVDTRDQGVRAAYAAAAAQQRERIARDVTAAGAQH